MKPYHSDGQATLYQGDCRDVLRELPAASVQCVVTSPPYVGQRDYGAGVGEVGKERTMAAYTEVLVEVFREVRRVLRDDGTLWVNVGHKFNLSGGAGGDYNDNGLREGQARYGSWSDPAFKPKDCLPIAWFLGPALMADGWYHRCPVVWNKPAPMPGSQTDRPTLAHEDILLFSKRGHYFYDQTAVSEPMAESSITRISQPTFSSQTGGPKDYGHGINPDRSARKALENMAKNSDGSRTQRSVWTMNTQPFPDAHYAVFPEELPRKCILAGTSEKGCCPECGAPWERTIERGEVIATGGGGNMKSATERIGYMEQRVIHTTGWRPTCHHDAAPVPCVVLDPFAGTFTTGKVAKALGRHAVGIELSEDYCQMAVKRCAQMGMTL